MSAKNEMPRFPYPMRGLGVIAIFLVVAPPVQVCVEIFMNYAWVGGRQLLVEIAQVIRENVLSGILPGYSIYMLPVFVAGVSSAIGPARGKALTAGGTIARMVMAGLVFEGIYQTVVVASGGSFMAGNVIIGMVQWILSGWLSWIVATGFWLDKPAAR